MDLEFTKMSGAGNDFILIDNREGEVSLTPVQVRQLCDRHKGIGADGLFLLQPARGPENDFSWMFYNSDGSSADMCGNGARCFARYARKVTAKNGTLRVETGAGVITAVDEGRNVRVSLTQPRDLQLRRRIDLQGQSQEVHTIHTGVPHTVIFVPALDRVDVAGCGRQIRFHHAFGPKGTNVNFVETISTGDAAIAVRTFERGVDGETLACGTGVTASALVTAALHGQSSPIRVRVASGEILEVEFDRVQGEFTAVKLSGPADFIFEGRISLPRPAGN